MKRFNSIVLVSAAVAMAVCGAKAEIVLLSPEEGSTFQLLTDWQMKVFAGATRHERYEILKGADKNATSNEWRCQRPLVLKWKVLGRESSPWRVRLATKEDLSDARDFWVEHGAASCVKSADGRESTWKYVVPLANLDLDTTYYWQVWSDVKCSAYGCGFTYPDKCKCGKSGHGTISAVASFRTSAEPPRWIAREGRLKNIRDIGGGRTVDGRRVRTHLAYRGQGLNDNSLTGLAKGRNRLMVEDVAYMIGTLGIKTDLDLRYSRETADMTQSPLGPGVRFIHHSSCAYADLFNDKGKRAMAENFRVFCDRGNYPIFFHCIGGADRTGTLAYVLNGLLGVPKEDLERDWESTFYPKLPGVESPKAWCSMAHLDEGFAKYGNEGDPLTVRIALFLLDCGVTQEELETFKKIMLEGD